MEMKSLTVVAVSAYPATLGLEINLMAVEGPDFTGGFLLSLPRSEQVALTREMTVCFAQLVQEMGLPLSVIGESMQNTGSLSKAVGKGDSNWLGDSLIQLRRDTRREEVIQKEREREKAIAQAKARR